MRLWGIDPSQLPPATATPQEISPFLHSILLEAIPFLGDLPPWSTPTAQSPWKHKGDKKYPHSVSPVQLFERTITSEELHDVAAEYHIPHLETSKLQPETWFLRRSTHEDAAASGTAAWDEWVRCFKTDHAQAEKQFTPTVMRTAVEREWDCQGVVLELEGTRWVDWTLKVEESTHKMPAPLKPRTFPVVQATAAAEGRREFLVVQIAAVDENPGEEERKRQRGGDGDDIKGVYTSVERVREVEGGDLEWVMGTVSDAKGVLPAWVQRLATPGAVAKDVEKFLAWIAEERHRKRSGDANGGTA